MTHLFSGALFETPVPGGEVGPTNGKIIADQFERLKYGDRFFFNHNGKGNARGLGPVAQRNIIRYKTSTKHRAGVAEVNLKI